MTPAPTSLAGADVLVTGGAGTIGSTIVDRLLATGVNRVDVLDNLVRGRRENLESALADGRVRLIEGDIRDRDLVDSVTRGKDVVFHQAAIRITQCAEDPRLAFDVLAQGSFTVFEAAAAHRVGRVVAASSASIYGLATRFPTHEQHHPYANDTFYGAAKAFTEGMLTSFGAMSDLHSTALRYFNVYGPRMDVHGLYTEVLVRWMERIESGVPPLILGDGSQTMDFVHVDDVARANVLAATAGHDGAFNIGSGVETSLLGLARTLLEVMESDLDVEFAPARQVNGVTRRLADTRSARDELGFVADVDLASGLRSLVQWWRGERIDAPLLSGANR
ncbi:NAD-dependent epimerase [Rathayibacter sp. Leaf185]|nr:NAD-dependent epimerase [Rathayibacter sp. Leaf294]KQS11647.1 NAD-dependent epimerase [Rathayibacter sp. Leaf185]